MRADPGARCDSTPHAHERDLWLTYMILVSYSLVTASKRDNEQDLWLSYMITVMYSLVAASM